MCPGHGVDDEEGEEQAGQQLQAEGEQHHVIDLLPRLEEEV